MSHFDQIATEIKELSERWRLSDNRCPECDLPLYQHIMMIDSRQDFMRCAVCRTNYYTTESVIRSDKPAERKLDMICQLYPLALYPPRAKQ